MTPSAPQWRIFRKSSPFMLVATLAACEVTSGTNPGDGSSTGEQTTDPAETSSSTGPASGSSTEGPIADDSGTSTTGETETDTDGPEPVPSCQSNACYTECTQELQTEDAAGEACTCTTEATPPDWVWCELPHGCAGLNDYTCILESLRDGVVGRYTWSYVERDTGGETMFIELLEPGRARALASSFVELACCGVQSTDAGQYHAPFDLPAPDDPVWDECLALAPEIVDYDPVPECLRLETLRVGECTGEPLVECPAG